MAADPAAHNQSPAGRTIREVEVLEIDEPISRSDRMRKAAPIACSVAVAAVGVLVWRNDPAVPGSRFPSCAFHSATGLWCPGCGLTRGVHALFNGHVGAALSSNVFTPVALVAIVWLLVSWMRLAWGHTALRLPQGVERSLIFAAPAVVFAYGLLRNIPVSPLRALAP